MIFLNKAGKTEKLKKKLIDIVANHPEQIKESCRHMPGEAYVIIDNKRVYFTHPHHSPPEITEIYKKDYLYGKCRKAKKFFEKAYHNKSWFNLFKPEVFFPVLGVAAFFYFGFIEPEEAKIQRFEKICSSFAGFKEGHLLDDGRMEFSGRRNVIDGTSESIKVIADPAGWLFFRGDNEVRRYIPKNRASVTESFSYNDGDVLLNRENKKWIHGTMDNKKIEWDNPQGTDERKGKIYGHTKKENVLTDLGKK